MISILYIIIISLLFFRRFWCRNLVNPYWGPDSTIMFEIITFCLIWYFRSKISVFWGSVLAFIWMSWAIVYFASLFATTLYFVHDGQVWNLEILIKKKWWFYHPSNLKKPGMFDYSMTMMDIHRQFYVYLIIFWFLIIIAIIIFKIVRFFRR